MRGAMATLMSFGPFELDPAVPMLRRDGRVLKAGRRALDLLAALVEARGAVVSKPALMDRAWPGLFVDEANLTVQMSALRRLLGRRDDGGDWIVTVPGLGYRFAPGTAGGGGRDERPGLAVLPFDHAEGDADIGYFADGVVTDLIAALYRFRGILVIARNVAFACRGQAADSRALAAALGVGYVLEGSLRRDGDRLRVVTALVDGRNGGQIWCGRFDGSLGDVFAVQDRIVESVAAHVAPQMLDSEIARSRRERPASVAVYDLALRALADLKDESEPANRRAFALLERALVLEPDNAALLCHAAWALEHRHAMGWTPLGEDDVGLCLRLTRRSLQHGRGDARLMAQCAMNLMQAGRDYASAIAIAKAAVAANANDPLTRVVAGLVAAHCGDLDEAEAHLSHVLAMAPLDPDTRFALCGLAMIAIIRGDDHLALARAGHALAVNPHFDATYWMLIAANAYLGQMAEARRHVAALRRLVPGVTVARIRRGQPAMIPARLERLLDGLRRGGLPDT